MPDAFDVNIFRVDPKAVRERRKNSRFMRGVVTVNVEVGRGFGVTQFLRVGQDCAEIRAFQFHARQNVIARSIHDAVKRRDAVADKSFAQRFDDGNAAAHARFVIKIRAVFFRGGKKFFAVRGQQSFVRGDNGLAEFQRSQNDFARNRGAADEFGDEIHFGIAHDFAPVGRQQIFGNGRGAFFLQVAHGDAVDFDVCADARAEERAVARERFKHAAAHGSTADDSKINLLHN